MRTLVLAVFALAALVAAGSAPAQREGTCSSSCITEYTVPTPEVYDGPFGIAPGLGGDMWFGDQDTVGRIDSRGHIVQYPVPSAGADVGWVVEGFGSMWFTERGTGKIGRVDNRGHITEYATSSPDSGPQGIVAGPDGAIWFTERDTDKIARLNRDGTVSEYQVPTADAGPQGLAVGPDGALWFTERFANQIGRIDLNGHFAEYPLAQGANPQRITVGQDGALWFTVLTGSLIGRITTHGQLTEFPLDPAAAPVGITSGPDHALWFVEFGTSKIARMNLDGAVTNEWAIPTAAPFALQIAAGPGRTLLVHRGRRQQDRPPQPVRPRGRTMSRAGLARLLVVAGIALAAATAAAAAKPRIVTVHTPGFPAHVAAAYGSIWVISHRGGYLYRIDPHTTKVVATIDVADALCWIPFPAEGKLWVSGCETGGPETTYEIDPLTNRVVGRRPGILGTFGDGSLWTTDPPRKLVYRVDPKSGLILARIHPPGVIADTTDWGVGGVAYGSAWVITKKTVDRIDTATNKVTTVIPLPHVEDAVYAMGEVGPSSIALANGKVWLVQYPGLYEIDPATNLAKLTSVRAGPFSQWGDVPLVAKQGSLWLRTTNTKIARVDPHTATVVATYPAAGGGGGLTVAFGSLWVANAGRNTVWRETIG